ncbi:MAG: hypothetical protein J2P39_08365 [Candidatus Dormibacteraeota bacterium]|nr:hypothetical protein [Candidatus Dormibacteraeota bacterium]
MDDAAWLELFHRIGGRVAEAVSPLLGTEAGRVELGRGAGGDRTVALDERAEEVALTELRGVAADGERFSVLSEEAGHVDLGAPYPVVFIDPVDGSVNAKRGVPVAGVMLSLLDGPTLDDVRIGVVHNLYSGERWHAVRDDGLHRQGRPVTPYVPERPRIEVVGIESSPRNLPPALPLAMQASKVRLLGSIAISLAAAAAGAMDVFCSAMPARAFDMTAGILMLREVGGVVTDFEGQPVGGVEAGLTDRSTLLCAASPGMHERALASLHGV